MRKILLSLLSIGAVAAIAVYASQAFFSDTETSTGNILQAGAIDLLIDNESYVTGHDGKLTYSRNTSWSLEDPMGVFFNFYDLKPGDIGEDTISIHVNNNDAWLCAAARITQDSDVDYTEPELADDSTKNLHDPLQADGELAENVEIAFWADDGDNVLETDEVKNIFLEGPISGLGQAGKITLADSQKNVWEQAGKPLPGGTTRYIGKAWCFGDLTHAPVKPGNGGPLDLDEEEKPRGTGFNCSGAPSSNNSAQTDRVMGDIQFYAVQSRNNSEFSCNNWNPNWSQNLLKVGANLSNYIAPTNCDITVTDGEGNGEIQAAINSAQNGDTICVDNGTYNETVTINKSIILASLSGASATATITGGVNIQADNVTVKGFKVNQGTLADAVPAAFYLKDPIDNTLSNITIRDNDIDGTGSVAGSRGILNAEAGTFSNVLIENNRIHGFTTGIYMSTVSDPGNTATLAFTIRYNDIEVKDNAGDPKATAGIGQLNEALVTRNHFTGFGTDPEAIGAGPDYDNSIVSFNNFKNDTHVVKYATWPTIDNNPPYISAEDNFWGPNGGANQTKGAVDFTPEAAEYTKN